MASGLLSLKWNNHRSTFFHVLSSIRSKESYCDATLACDGRFYPVHKLVLSTCSEYFEQIFERTQCKHPVIVLKDIKFEDLEALMNYMYVGEVNVLQEKLSGLIKAAECLRIKGLAVPDEDPFASKENRRNQHRTEFESPRAKRRRRDDSFSNEERVKNVSSRERPLVRDPQPLENHENNILASPKATDLSSQGLMSSFSKSDKLVVAVESEIQDEEDTETNSKPNSGEVIPPKITSHKRNVEISMVETNVKAEPPDIEIPGDDDLDSKENLNSDLGYDQDSVGGDESGSAHGGNDSEYSENLMESAPQSVEDVVAQALPSSSNFQGNSFSLWEGENSLQNFPGEGFSGENSQGRQVTHLSPSASKPIWNLWEDNLLNASLDSANESSTSDSSESSNELQEISSDPLAVSPLKNDNSTHEWSEKETQKVSTSDTVLLSSPYHNFKLELGAASSVRFLHIHACKFCGATFTRKERLDKHLLGKDIVTCPSFNKK